MSEADIYGSVASPQGKYFKLKDGEEARIRICSDSSEALIYEKEFERDGKFDLSTRFAYVVWNYDAGLAQVWSEVSGATYDKIKKLIMNKDYGDITQYDVTVSREGEQLQTKYDIIAARENTELPGTALAAVAKIELKAEVEKGKGVQHVMSIREFHEMNVKQPKGAEVGDKSVY